MGKKKYVAPNFKYSMNGTMEGVFAAGQITGDSFTLTGNVMNSSYGVSAQTYCRTGANWLVDFTPDDNFNEE